LAGKADLDGASSGVAGPSVSHAFLKAFEDLATKAPELDKGLLTVGTGDADLTTQGNPAIDGIYRTFVN
jgi:hypothetical protein